MDELLHLGRAELERGEGRCRKPARVEQYVRPLRNFVFVFCMPISESAIMCEGEGSESLSFQIKSFSYAVCGDVRVNIIRRNEILPTRKGRIQQATTVLLAKFYQFCKKMFVL